MAASFPYIIPPCACWSSSIAGINANARYFYDLLQEVGDATAAYVTFEYPGVLTDETSFGYLLAPITGTITSAMLTVGEVATGNDITAVVTINGTETGSLVTLAAGQEYQTTTFGTPIDIVASDIVRMKIKSIGGSGTEGAFLTVLLTVNFSVA